MVSLMLWSSVLLPELSELPEAGSAAAGVSVPPEELDDEADSNYGLHQSYEPFPLVDS